MCKWMPSLCESPLAHAEIFHSFQPCTWTTVEGINIRLFVLEFLLKAVIKRTIRLLNFLHSASWLLFNRCLEKLQSKWRKKKMPPARAIMVLFTIPVPEALPFSNWPISLVITDENWSFFMWFIVHLCQSIMCKGYNGIKGIIIPKGTIKYH